MTPNFLQLKYDQITFQQAWCPKGLCAGKAPSTISLCKVLGR